MQNMCKFVMIVIGAFTVLAVNIFAAPSEDIVDTILETVESVLPDPLAIVEEILKDPLAIVEEVLGGL